MFEGPFSTSMLLKAQQLGLAEIKIWDLREFGMGPRRQVDDTPYGGGSGMLIRPEPVFDAVEAVKLESPEAKVLIMAPTGQPYRQSMAHDLALGPDLIILAGHYEGFDERIMSLADHVVSMGDFVLTGGEIPAMAITDSVVRLIPGVLGGENSASDESFTQNLLEHPHYTRPAEFRGMSVPEVLQSGHHGQIKNWREQESLKKTQQNRPDLLNPEKNATAEPTDRQKPGKI